MRPSMLTANRTRGVAGEPPSERHAMARLFDVFSWRAPSPLKQLWQLLRRLPLGQAPHAAGAKGGHRGHRCACDHIFKKYVCMRAGMLPGPRRLVWPVVQCLVQ